jgi:hypothetical protein
MKATLKSSMKNTAMFLFAVVILFNSTNAFAGGFEKVQDKLGSKKYSKAVSNLMAGINSENLGLKKSCIYYAGLYEIPEAVDVLIKQMKNESDPDVKILIALSLYKIGDTKGYSMIKAAAEKDNDPKVRNMCIAICNTFNEKINSDIMKTYKTNY